jgi:hypothetical protein
VLVSGRNEVIISRRVRVARSPVLIENTCHRVDDLKYVRVVRIGCAECLDADRAEIVSVVEVGVLDHLPQKSCSQHRNTQSNTPECTIHTYICNAPENHRLSNTPGNLWNLDKFRVRNVNETSQLNVSFPSIHVEMIRDRQFLVFASKNSAPEF